MMSYSDINAESIIELYDEKDNPMKFQHIMTMDYNGTTYICLVPAEPMDDIADDEMLIMRIEVCDKCGSVKYETITDETELDAVFEKYLQIQQESEDE